MDKIKKLKMKRKFCAIVFMVGLILTGLGCYLYSKTDSKTIVTATEYEYGRIGDVNIIEPAFIYFNLNDKFLLDCNESAKVNLNTNNYHQIIISLGEDKYYLTCEEFFDFLVKYKKKN